MSNYQAPNTPFSSDVPSPRDQGLLWSREFGTNVGADLGDAFNTDVGGAPVMFEQNARAGSCDIWIPDDANPGNTLHRGRSWLLPDWTVGTPYTPDGVDDTLRAAFLIARLRFPSMHSLPANYDEPPGIALIAGEENLVGDVDDTNFLAAELRPAYDQNVTPPAAPPWDAGTAGEFSGGYPWPVYVRTGEWETAGGGAPPTEQDGQTSAPAYPTDAYLRMFMNYSTKIGSTVIQVSASTTGLAWQNVGFGEVDGAAARRVGFSLRGSAWGALDWVRLYQFTLEGSDAEIQARLSSAQITGGLLTGNRLFV